MALRKKDLEQLFEFQSRNLPDNVKHSILKATGRGGVSKAADYISANCLLSEVVKANPTLDLSTIQTEEQLWSKLHPATRFRLKAYTPCLASRIDELSEPEQKRLFTDKNVVFSRKENGVRCWVIIYKGTVHAYSRNYSDVDCSLLEYWDNVYQQIDPAYDGIYAIDTEIKFEPGVSIAEDLEHLGISTDSPLEAMTALLHTHPEDAIAIQKRFKDKYHSDLITFRLIAPLYFNGKNYTKRILGEGIDVYDECLKFGQSLGLNLKAIPQCDGSKEEKEVFLNTILEQGGEGVVCWFRSGIYNTSENRSKTSFVKIKRKVGSNEGLGDEIEGFVTGYKMGNNGTANEGLISALEFTIYINKSGQLRKHVIAICPNIDKETKLLCTWNNADGCYPQEVTLSDGTTKWVSLNPEFDGLVGSLVGQAISRVSLRLEHPALQRWRVERNPESCIYTQEFIDANTTNVGITYKNND